MFAKTILRRALPFFALFCFWLVRLPHADAQINYVAVYQAESHRQVGDGANLNLQGYFFSLSLTSDNDNDFVRAEATTPTESTYTLTQVSPSTFRYQTAFYSSQDSMNADFPTGTYQFTAFDSAENQFRTSAEYLHDRYSNSLPYLTGTNYSALQNMNPAQEFHFQFSDYEPGEPNEAALFFFIYDSNGIVFDSGPLDSTTTSLILPENTLTFSTDYTYELIFSNRDRYPSVDTTQDAYLVFDRRTVGQFTTAVPGPSPILILGGGFLPVLYRLRRRK